MSITAIEVENFKGIDGREVIALAPITLFLGPNSSGKSSCIHALTLLSQTLKLPNNLSPLALDDEHASVHLGRWIDVLHRKSYRERLRLGITTSEIELPDFLTSPKKPTNVSGAASVRLTFKSSLRTQEVALEQADYEIGTIRYSAKREADGSYRLTRAGEKDSAKLQRRNGFLFSEVPSGKGSIYQPAFLSFTLLQGFIQRELLGVQYLGPFRQAPRRPYPTRGGRPTEVGAEGEAAITLLANEVVQTQKRPHIREIAGWLRTLGLAQQLKVTRLGTSDIFNVHLTLEDGAQFPIADLGYGLSQVLPVLTQCSFSPKRATLLFEQPELHLHPLAAVPLARVFQETAAKGRAIVAETHSPQLINGVQQLVADGLLKPEDVAVYLVARSDRRTCVKRVAIDADGEIQDNWERGVSRRV